MDKPAKVTTVSFLVIVGFACAAGYHYARGAYLSQPYPQNTFLFLPAVHGSDFRDVVRDGHTLSPYLDYSSAQYPFLALIGFVFSLIPKYRETAFLVLVSVAFLLLSMASLRLGDWRCFRDACVRDRIPLVPIPDCCRSCQLRVAGVRPSSGVHVLLCRGAIQLQRSLPGPCDRAEALPGGPACPLHSRKAHPSRPSQPCGSRPSLPGQPAPL